MGWLFQRVKESGSVLRFPNPTLRINDNENTMIFTARFAVHFGLAEATGKPTAWLLLGITGVTSLVIA